MMKIDKCIRALADINQINDCKKEIDRTQESISRLSNVLSLSGNEVRLKILYLVYKEQKLCVCDMSDILDHNGHKGLFAQLPSRKNVVACNNGFQSGDELRVLLVRVERKYISWVAWDSPESFKLTHEPITDLLAAI